jgi:hypothetical protein
MKNTKKRFKSKKNTKTYKRLKTNKKYIGGTIEEIKALQNSLEKVDLESNTNKELEKLKHDSELKKKGLLQKATNIVNQVTVNTLERVGKALDFNITNPEETTRKLEKIKESLSNPKNIKIMGEIVDKSIKEAAIFYKAAEPLINPIVKKTLDITSESVKELANTSGIIVENTIKAIPGVGLYYKLAENVDSIGEAVLAVTNATAALTTDLSNSAVVFKKNLEQLKKEGFDTQNRVNKSLQEFEKPKLNMPGSYQKGGKLN